MCWYLTFIGFSQKVVCDWQVVTPVSEKVLV